MVDTDDPLRETILREHSPQVRQRRKVALSGGIGAGGDFRRATVLQHFVQDINLLQG
ncbi:MAG: hypothetical protein VX863_01590 [Candidatus Thermoplasmatota archaeon]|nr:hypothetical protein [Candidatus Thermoplasmatota archaeon]